MPQAPHKSRTISQVVADNLKHFMEVAGESQNSLAKKTASFGCKVGQTTIGLMLNPARRDPRKSGKPSGPNLAQLDAVAKALGLELWELVSPMNAGQRQLHKSVMDAMRKAKETADQ